MDMNKLFMELYTEKFGKVLNREIAEDIVKNFAVTDGSGNPDGMHWTYDEAKSLGDKLNVDWEKVSKCEYFTVLNMMYSDYGQTVKKHGLPDTILGEFAKDWFMDVDGDPDKTFKYFIHL
ncbi:MAG: hypothetical protein MJ181_11410 [Treponema sp.]|nr:hypothetical protein [Treponema sp.]